MGCLSIQSRVNIVFVWRVLWRCTHYCGVVAFVLFSPALSSGGACVSVAPARRINQCCRRIGPYIVFDISVCSAQ